MKLTKRLSLYISIIVINLFSTKAISFEIMDIVNMVAQMYGINVDIFDNGVDQLSQLQALEKNLSGTFKLGNQYYSSERYAWGNQSDSWQSIIAMSKNGTGNGQLGKTILSIAKDFSIDSVNSPNSIENEYYKLQAATALSSRSASEVTFEQAVKEEKTLKKLHSLIDTITTQKEATDFNNRIASEQAITSVQQTKLLSILVQQEAIRAQERANRAREDMEFFNME